MHVCSLYECECLFIWQQLLNDENFILRIIALIKLNVHPLSVLLKISRRSTLGTHYVPFFEHYDPFLGDEIPL